jgi:hypothetical protein
VNILDEIRPRAEHLTDQHSRTLLNSVTNTPRRERKPRWSRVAAVGLTGVIVAGGTAYGTGHVPQIVSERFQQIEGGEDGWPYPIHNEREIADVALSNGKHARVWYADTTDGQCVVRDMTGDVTRPEDFGAGCARWGYSARPTDPRRGTHWQISVNGPAVVYGDFVGVSVKVARVIVKGPGWTRSFSIENSAFAGEVPAGANGDLIQFSYLDARGNRMERKVVAVGLESE